ncbi:hypothetical protein [Brevibacillus laterosporus]|uniref:hypothetical protein n=1 Tax=Brevibacillus laterosporus TaxID=1465 RepID=UPI0018F87310|nr:hypothetical protein [Brevibacillus laterosporus]MBG9772434.1 hypothetical protein [Brevibacillus laterosporus]
MLDSKFYYSSSIFLGAFIPIGLTLYFFAYRAQQSTSARNLIIRNYFFLAFISSALITVGYGKHLGNIFEFTPLTIEKLKQLQSKSFIYMMLYVFSIVHLIPMIQSLLRSTSLRITLEEKIKQSRDAIKTVANSPLEKHRGELYGDLHVYVETIYQLLDTAIEKNMNDIFKNNYKKWTEILVELQQAPLDRFSTKVISERLIEMNKDEFQSYYSSILSNHIKIILTLIKSFKIEQAQEGIETFLELKPHIDELQPIYNSALLTLTISSYENKELGIRPVLNILEKHLTEDDNGTKIYKWLLIKSIKENNVKSLTTTVYSAVRAIKRLEMLSNPAKQSTPLRILIRNSIERNGLTVENNKKVEAIRNTFMEFFLEAIIKSIELAHYGCTGFLLKFLVTNMKSDFVDKTYPIVQNRYKNDEYNVINDKVSFNINLSTFEYCNQKLLLLLFGQQKYVLKHKLKVTHFPKQCIDLSDLEFDNLEYHLNKIDKAKSKYGLLYLEDAKFMKEFTDEVYYLIRKHKIGTGSL